ncbi:phage tail spike protein [uncultured Leuconostoc sp.]|uniref:phage tail spike protein n=1 Tax=uncultured Leuconostoc sp. TaxID=173262 RepID=UPI002805EE1C|nr:phage tail spike protein [uncultured Leuconostoc sp.]
MSSPIIFEKGTRDFSTLGLGLLSDAIQATTTEELNGQFIFEMDYPVSGNNADLIRENRIIVVNSGHILKRQGFIIRQIVRKIDLTMTVYAEHVSYATLDVALAPIGTISGDAKTALENWKRMLVPAVDFTVDSDILTTNSTSIGAPEFETARQGLGGHAGSILDVWGGEYQFDNWHIRLLKQRGKSANAIIAYGRNLISFEQDTNIADTYTSVYPYYQENSGDDGNKTHFLPERTVDSEFVGKYPNPKVLMLDLSNKFKDVADYSETKLRNYALSYIQSNNIGVPKVNMKISTVDLSRATGGFSEDIDLGDTVNVYFEKLGITTSAKVIKAVWNVLSDDYDKFEIGARRSSLTESISELATTADENANKALNQALVALQSADGKSTIYYLNSSDPWPTNPNENDTAFVKDGENSIMYRYMFNNDTGVFSWVKILDSMSADQIKQRVSDALESGKAYSDQLVADNVAQVNAVLDDVQAKQADLTAQQAELDTKAQGYANKALADAKADTLATATQTAKDASDALAKAKTDLTTSLNKEVTDRANAVTALDTKAKGYADTAKTDAINAATTADGVINKKIDDTASSITSTISQNKTDTDGKITTAQSTATQALNGLATKVSQTVYDAKTGQLQTDLNTTTTTANQAKTDIVAIKSDNTKQDARMTTIESDANGTKTTVSNLQTDLGKANGSITTLQQRADGFDATVTKVNNLSVGGRNLLLHTNTNSYSTLNSGNGQYTTKYVPFDGGYKYQFTYTTASTNWAVYQFLGFVKEKYEPDTEYVLSFMANVSTDIKPGISFSNGAAQHNFVKQVTFPTILSSNGDQKVVVQLRTNSSIPDESDQTLYINGFVNKVGTFSIWDLKIETGNLPTDWSPAPEDLSSATAKAQLTADQATTSLNNYKTDADGRISKAQADIVVNANAITQKVSQSDYNAKTGDLTTKVNTAQSTADSATSTIGAYKTSNDARVASAESKITANATAITSKVSQSDYNTKTGQIDGQISTINQTAGKISQSVADVNGRIDNISVGGTNLLLGSQDFTGTGTERWVISGTIVANAYQGLSAVQSAGAWSGPKYQERNLVARWGALDTTNTFTLSEWVRNTSTTQVDIKFYGDNVQGSGLTVATLPANSDWVRVSAQFKFLVATPSSGARIRFEPITAVTGGYVQHAGMKLESGTLASSYSPAPEDTDNKISTVSQTVDGISSIVSDPTTGLTKRIQTAEGTLSQVTGADIPALQKATYWQAPNGYDLNTYLTQGSTFFRDTTARTNAPTTSTKWMYLVVERTPNGDRVTQTAWYDTQTDAKITYRRQYAGTWGAWYANDNDSVATIAQTNGAIKTEISDRQKGDTNTLTQAKDFTTSSISNSESGMRSLITQTSDAILGKVGAVNLFPNSEFEKDYGYRTKNPGVTLSLTNKDLIDGKYNGTVTVKATNAGWQGYWARNIEVQGGQKYSGSVLVHYTNGGVTGGYATLDRWFVDKDGNRINGGVGGTGKGTVGEVTSPYWTQLYFEGVTAPDNAVNLQVSLLTNDKGIGQTAIFAQPMVTATEKLQPYTPNNDITTQLALLKDNWSIGIADNAGAITNGIVGNSTNMSLISNNVVINAPSTQIKGTAWINSAMIANGAIGTAQIGDASISSAKITSLDVAKLTGNVSSFIQSNWNGVFASTMIDNTGMSINGGNTTTKFDTTGAHYSNSSGINATYSFGKWSDSNSNATSATGLYIGATGSSNAFINILSTNGAAALVLAGTAMDFGSNLNVLQGALNAYVNVNIRERLMFKANRYVGGQPSYIEVDEINRTFNFFTGGGSGTNKDYFYFNQNVISAGTFSSTSVLSKKNVKSVYDEDALGEIAKTQLVNFEYKNRIGQNHVSPIIDDVNSEKEYYIPKTILGQDNEYVDMYSMISMAWRAIQQLNEKIGDK